jgi:hypothetical protein
MLTKEQILAADDRPTEEVEVPQWGGTVFVKTMSGTEKDAYENDCMRINVKGKKVNFEDHRDNSRAKLLVLCIVDENGNRLFDESDIKALGNKSCAALDTVYEVAARLNKQTPEDLETMAKNSDGGQTDSSISD